MASSATRREFGSAAPLVRELWAELSATMRRLRTAAEMSLRQAEAESGIGRGTLSQFETAKARPNRGIVEFYDTAFGGDGLLLSLYAEARGAHGPTGTGQPVAHTPGDALAVLAAEVPFGAVVGTGNTLTVAWTLRNAGRVAWQHRCLERVGARSGIRLITSDASVPVPDCPPGESVECTASITIPNVAATYVAYWQMTDERGRPVLEFEPGLCVQVVARDLS